MESVPALLKSLKIRALAYTVLPEQVRGRMHVLSVLTHAYLVFTYLLLYPPPLSGGGGGERAWSVVSDKVKSSCGGEEGAGCRVGSIHHRATGTGRANYSQPGMDTHILYTSVACCCLCHSSDNNRNRRHTSCCANSRSSSSAAEESFLRMREQ